MSNHIYSHNFLKNDEYEPIFSLDTYIIELNISWTFLKIWCDDVILWRHAYFYDFWEIKGYKNADVSNINY